MLKDMNKEYYIIGSGGFAKEVRFLAESTLDENYFFKGYIDKMPLDDSALVGKSQDEIITEDYFFENIEPSPNINLFMGVGDPNLLKKLSESFKSYSFPNLVSKDAVIDLRSISLGKGNIFTAGCILTVDIKVDSFNVFNLNATVGHEAEIGSFNIFNPGANISGNVKIKSCNLFGVNSTILQNLEVGHGNILGASSLATKSIGDNQIMVGVPAKNITK